MRAVLTRRLPTEVETPLLALPLFSDRLPTRGHTAWCDWRMDGAISSLVLEGLVTGELGQKLMIAGAFRVGAERLLIYGMGLASDASPEGLQRAVAQLASDVTKLKLGSWSLGVVGREIEGLSYRNVAASTLRGLLQASEPGETVRLIEEESERFGLLVREVPTWLRAMAGTYGHSFDLVLEEGW